MQVLELVHRLELDDVQSIGNHSVGFALEEMLRLVCSDMGHGGEDVGTVGSRAFNAVSVIDTALSSLVVDIEIL